MKRVILVLLLLLLTALLVIAGCIGAPSVPAPSSQGQGGQDTPVTPSTVAATGTRVSGKVIIDERTTLMSGYPTTYRKYSFENYGYQYLYPGDTFRISLNSDKPVNVLVIDKADEIKFPAVIPEWNTVLKKDQWDYSPVVPAFSQSNVLRKDMTFTIEDKSMYFLIIDPRFASEQTWQGTKHEDVNIDVKVTKI